MFAGAAREAVFSKAEVIRKINADFVPVALKAALVNQPPNDDEGRLYREIGRSKLAPQGICVVNTDGKVLTWALMFDDDRSVLEFLDHALQRFRDHPDATLPVTAERFMKFPGQRLPDTPDSGERLEVPERHSSACPAKARFQPGTIIARVIGRALGKDGEPIADTVRQEHYIEDRFEISVGAQGLLARALAAAGSARFKVPEQVARLLVSHAFLGQLDVNPLGSPAGGDLDQPPWEFWTQRVESTEEGEVQLRIEGKSEISGGELQARSDGRRDGRSDGRIWEHSVRLAWEGLIEMRGGNVTRLLIKARGSEKLRWGNALMPGGSDVSRLPAGHPIDVACEVRYGIIGEPVSGDEAAPLRVPPF